MSAGRQFRIFGLGFLAVLDTLTQIHIRLGTCICAGVVLFRAEVLELLELRTCLHLKIMEDPNEAFGL